MLISIYILIYHQLAMAPSAYGRPHMEILLFLEDGRDSSYGSTELCSLWPIIMELAAGIIKSYAHPNGIF